MDQIHIELSKKKFRKLLFLSVFCFLLALFFVIKPTWFLSGFISSKTVIIIFGIIAILFFGPVLVYTLRKMSNKSLGLFIDENGITDYSSSFRFGLIEWQDIKNIQLINSSGKQLIMIETNQPEKYLNSIKSPIFRSAAEQNMKLYGSHLLIWCSLLEIQPKELESLLNNEFRKNKKP